MKLTWLATILLFTSVNAFAACPPGTQGSSQFDEAAAILKRVLGQNLRPGSHADEKTKQGDDRPLRMLFGKSGDKVAVTIYRSSGKGKTFDIKAAGPVVADMCAGGGQVLAIAGVYTIPISRISGGLLSITLASYGTYQFYGITNSGEVANDKGSGR